jgi:hypothetical protein
MLCVVGSSRAKFHTVNCGEGKDHTLLPAISIATLNHDFTAENDDELSAKKVI